jgi:hypothetical protein
MAVESGARASSTLTGDLRGRPLPVLLAGACERSASGTFSFFLGDRCNTVTMRLGKIAVVRTAEPIAYLGGILYEMGVIDVETLNLTLREVATRKRLHGDILVEQGQCTRDRVEEGLVEQTLRQVHHLFTLPEETKWTFREDVDVLAGFRDEGRPATDTWQAIWRGLRDQPVAPHVRRTLAKIDGGVYLRDLAAVGRFGLSPEERALCERLNAQPALLETLIATSGLATERVEHLVYVLALARCIVRVDTRPVGPLELGVEGIRLRAARIDDEDPATTLGLGAGASAEAARAAFFRLARLWHPDKLPPTLAEVRGECRHIFTRLGEAHRSLTNRGCRMSVEAILGPSDSVAANDSVAPPPATVRTTMRDADAALARNDIAAALAIARALTSAGADGPGARALVAWCAVGAGASADRGALERALAALDKILTGDPECIRALCYRAQVSKRLGNFDAALRDHKKIVRLDSGHVEAQREVRLHDMRRRQSSDGTSTPASCVPSPAKPASSSAVVLAAPGDDEDGDGDREPSLGAGLWRLLARVSGK